MEETAPREIVHEININDVLFGRGSPAIDNEGNIRFRQLVKELKSAYMATRRRQEKEEIALDIISTIDARGGRFLKKLDDNAQETNSWIVVDDETILQKVKQALREQGGTPGTSSDPASDDADEAEEARGVKASSPVAKSAKPAPADVVATPSTSASLLSSPVTTSLAAQLPLASAATEIASRNAATAATLPSANISSNSLLPLSIEQLPLLQSLARRQQEQRQHEYIQSLLLDLQADTKYIDSVPLQGLATFVGASGYPGTRHLLPKSVVLEQLLLQQEEQRQTESKQQLEQQQLLDSILRRTHSEKASILLDQLSTPQLGNMLQQQQQHLQQSWRASELLASVAQVKAKQELTRGHAALTRAYRPGGRASNTKTAEGRNLVPCALVEVFLLQVLCSHGLLFMDNGKNQHNWKKTGELLIETARAWKDRSRTPEECMASSFMDELRAEHTALYLAVTYSKDPDELAKKSIMLLEKIWRKSNSSAEKREAEIDVESWFASQQLQAWAMPLGVAEHESGHPIPFSMADYAILKASPNTDATKSVAFLDADACLAVISQIAYMTRLRSVFRHRQDNIQEKLVQLAASVGEGALRESSKMPKWWNKNICPYYHDAVLIANLLSVGCEKIVEIPEFSGTHGTNVSKVVLQERMELLTTLLHYHDAREHKKAVLNERCHRYSSDISNNDHDRLVALAAYDRQQDPARKSNLLHHQDTIPNQQNKRSRHLS